MNAHGMDAAIDQYKSKRAAHRAVLCKTGILRKRSIELLLEKIEGIQVVRGYWASYWTTVRFGLPVQDSATQRAFTKSKLLSPFESTLTSRLSLRRDRKS
jgi:hypothetical protein